MAGGLECMSRTGNLSSGSLWSHQARPRQRLSPGTATNGKYFIVLAFQMAGGGGVAERGAKRSLPVELIGYSENNVPLAEILRGPNARAVCEFFFFGVFKQERLGGAGRIWALAHSLKAMKKIIRGSEPNSANPQPN